MWYPGGPTKPPTPAEYMVLAVFVAVVLIVLGVVALVMAFRASGEQHALAMALTHRGLWAIGIGLFIVGVLWLLRRLKD